MEAIEAGASDFIEAVQVGGRALRREEGPRRRLAPRPVLEAVALDLQRYLGLYVSEAGEHSPRSGAKPARLEQAWRWAARRRRS